MKNVHTPLTFTDRCDSLDSNFRDILKGIDDLVINDETRTRINLENKGRFPFDQKFRKFRVWERLEQTFSGISFPNFGCTSRGWPKIPENRNNRKIPFHSTIPQCSRPVSQSPEIELNMASNSSAQYQCSACYYATDDLNVLLHHFFTGATANFRK